VKYIIVLLSLIKLYLSQVSVVSPQKLKDLLPNEFAASFANFGSIPYGTEMRGNLYFDFVNTDKEIACKPLFNLDGINMPKPDVAKSPMVLIDRGNCSFVTKVHNVEKVFGRAAIIVNNNEDDVTRIIMSDDGTGDDITIPAVLINKKQGDIIKQFFVDHSNDSALINEIMLSINFYMPVVNDSTRIDVFYTSDQVKVYKLFKDFNYDQISLSEHDQIVPHFITPRSIYYNRSVEKSYDHCVSSGKFCGIVPNDVNVTDGKVIVFEDLRQKCVYEYGKKNNRNLLYFEYMVKFYDACIQVAPAQFNEICANKVLKSQGLEPTDIQKCITDSFTDIDFIDLKPNTVLDQELKDKKLYNLVIYPGIMVNNRTFFGTWNAANLLEAACSGVKNKPKICEVNKAALTNSTESKGLSGTVWFFIIFFLVVFNLFIIYFCMRYISRKINERIKSDDIDSKINNIVSSYLSLTDK